MGNGIKFRLWRKDKERPRFGYIFCRAGGSVIGEELILIYLVKVIEQVVAGLFILFFVNLLPFLVNIWPESIEEFVDIRVGMTTAFPREILWAGRNFTLIDHIIIRIVEYGLAG